VRHVNLNEVGRRLPKTWAVTAAAALAAIENLAKEPRTEAIDRAPKWQQLRKIFGDVLDGKCWYCESKIKRSPTPIDHYRPKNRVREAPNHGGYWWLAYSWENYRFACSHCNTYGSAKTRGVAGGKADHFPLWNELGRAVGPRISPRSPDPIDAEQPLILDPTREADPPLLWFNPDGTVIPHPRICEDTTGYLHERAKRSIAILGLGQDELNERRGKHCEDILECLREADDLLIKANAGDATAAKQLDRRVSQLQKALHERAEYSAATRATLMAQRGTSVAVDFVL
jgi:uncharacterized protein (TIGR02646 family)